jgi:two-component system chemotaxis response regulator CheY
MTARILIAEDNAMVRGALRQVLEAAGGWEVVETANGKEALEQAQETRPDLVILDLAMPLMDGMTASREIVKLLPDVPVLIHTLYWSPRIEVEALKNGVRKVVQKSDSSAIVSAVVELLDPEPSLREGTVPAGIPPPDVPATVPIPPVKGAEKAEKPSHPVDGASDGRESS